MKKNIFVLISSILVLGSALAGCGSNDQSVSNGQSAEKSDSNKKQELRLNLHSEPPTADPGIADDNISGAVIRAVFDGLTRLGEDGKVHESVAEKIDVSDDMLTYTFHLRDTKWSNGEALTAKDFEFAWKRVLDPKTASNYAYQLYYIKNAEQVNKGKAALDTVGVKALDDKTLQVTLENPTPFFLELTAFYTYYPVNQKLVTANPKWATDAKTHVGNGPFKFDTWEHKSKMVLVKNENYWDKDAVKMEKINFSMVDDENTELSMFDNGEIDWAGRPLSDIPTDAIPALKDSGKMVTQPVASTYWYKFNTEKPPFNNVKIRKAFAYAIDRQSIVDNITMGNELAAMGPVPPTMALNPNGYFKDHDVETAKKLLAEGMKEMGITELPPISLMFNTSEKHKKIAEAIQDQWKKNLGVEVKLSNQEWKVYIDALHQGNYQVGRMGWNADFNDPINFLELFKDKKGGNNDTNWESPKYQELLNKSAMETDPEKRKQLLAEAEQVIMDEMPVVPIYFTTYSWVKADNVKGVVVDGLGFVDWKWATIE